MGGLLQQLEIFEGHRRGDDLNLTGITDGIAEANLSPVFTFLAGLGQYLPLCHLRLAGDHRLSIRRQVVDIACKHPHPAKALGLESDVALPVSDLTGLNRLLVAHLTRQVTDHIFSGLFNALLDCDGSNLSNGDIALNLLVVVNKQQRAVGDVDFLSFALAGRLDGEGEINLSLLCVDTMWRAVGANPCLAAEFNGASKFGTDHTGLGCGHTTGVESPHGELRSWLSDGLCRDDADRFTEVNKFVVGQCPPVAAAAN